MIDFGQTSNAADVTEFRTSESGYVCSQTEADEVKVAILGAQKAIECVDQKGHLSTYQSSINGRSDIIWQVGSVFPVDADDIDISLDAERRMAERKRKAPKETSYIIFGLVRKDARYINITGP